MQHNEHSMLQPAISIRVITRSTNSFDIAVAYAEISMVKSRLRTITLDRARDLITGNETFELPHEFPIRPSVMLQRTADVDRAGTTTLIVQAAVEVRPRLLESALARMKPDQETIKPSNPELRNALADEIWLMLLHSEDVVAKCKYTHQFRPALGQQCVTIDE